jgi:phenol 2-monooxygenase
MWGEIPRSVKEHSEMSFYSGYEMDDVYGIYGVDPAKGGLAIVRPDGYVGILASLTDVSRAERYLERLIRTI